MLPLLQSLRSLRREARFTSIAVLTLGIALGANAAIFTVADAVLLKPLPFAEPERLVGVWNRAPGFNLDKFDHSAGTYTIYRRHTRTLAGLGIYRKTAASVTGAGEPERVVAAAATGSLFEVLGVPPALGRGLSEADGRPGAEPVAVLADGLWRRRFGADRGVVGTTVQIDGVARRIVGVMPARLRFPQAETEMWLPLEIDPARPDTGNFSFTAVGRLRPGISTAAAARELSALVWRMPEELGDSDFDRSMIESSRLSVLVHALREDVVGDVERPLWLLLGSAGFLLLIACSNVANLVLVRAEGRARQVAVRTALGASRGKLARAFLAEGLALSGLAAVVGSGVAAVLVRTLIALDPIGIPRLEEVQVGIAPVAFLVGLALLCGLAFGAVATLRHGAAQLATTLKEGGRGAAGSRAARIGRGTLVVVQLVLALVLLVGSGLLAKSFWRLRHTDSGVEPKGLLTMSLALPEKSYPKGDDALRFVSRALAAVAALPQVAAVGAITELPLDGMGSSSGHQIEDFPQPEGGLPPLLPTRFVSPDYFRAMGIPLRAGRRFQALDPARRSDEAVVSAALAARYWPQGSALGKRLSPGAAEDGLWSTIHGVVGSVRDLGLDQPPAETVYYPFNRISRRGEDAVPRGFSLVVRSRMADPSRLAAPVRRALREIDASLPVARVRTMEEVVARSMSQASFTLLLLLTASGLALILGSVGIYGVVSYAVSQRTREIGVRMALGARRADISRMVVAEGFALAVAGIALGLGSAFAVTRVLAALLFEVSATDPPTFATVPVLLAAVALLASYLPARRAAAVEPFAAIRGE